jgi:hypothetical protein
MNEVKGGATRCTHDAAQFIFIIVVQTGVENGCVLRGMSGSVSVTVTRCQGVRGTSGPHLPPTARFTASAGTGQRSEPVQEEEPWSNMLAYGRTATTYTMWAAAKAS